MKETTIFIVSSLNWKRNIFNWHSLWWSNIKQIDHIILNILRVKMFVLKRKVEFYELVFCNTSSLLEI